MSDVDYELDNEILDASFHQYLTCRIGSDIFAADVHAIREAIELEHITPIPLVKDLLKGVINLRGVIVPVVDMAARFYASAIEITSESRIIIFEIEDGEEKVLVGALVDEVVSVVDILSDNIDQNVEFGANIRHEFIAGVGKVEDQFILLLNVATVLDIDELSALQDVDVDYKKALSADGLWKDDKSVDDSDEEDEDEDDRGHVIFMIGQEQYGISMALVNEVIKSFEITRIPNALPFMRGVINLRGLVVPLVDMRLRCGLEEKEFDNDTAIILVNFKGKQIGIIVDSVSDVVNIPENLIQDIPHYSAQIDRDFIIGIGQLDQRMIVLLDIDRIVTEEDLTTLTQNEPDTSGQ